MFAAQYEKSASIIERMQKGDLITHPSDRRIYSKDYDNYMKKSKNTDFKASTLNVDNENLKKIYFSREDIGKMTTREFMEIEDIMNCTSRCLLIKREFYQ